MTVCAGVYGCRAGWIAAFGKAADNPEIAIFRKLADLSARAAHGRPVAIWR